MSVAKEFQNERADEDAIEIRLSDVGRFLKNSRLTVGLWAGLFLLLGLLYAALRSANYGATVRVMPELKASAGAGGLNDLKSLAGLAGLSAESLNNPEAIRPDLYPDIVGSIPFTLHLLGQPVVPLGQTRPRRLQDYLLEQARQSLRGRVLGVDDPDEPINAILGSGTLQLSGVQEGLSKQLNQRVTAVIDKKSGIITLTVLMPDPAVAAQVARHTLLHLTNYVTNYRTSKARQQVRFLEGLVDKAHRRYQGAEYALSRYRDLNRSLYLNTAKIEEQRLQADYLLAQSVYNELSRQLEQARIKVQEEVPVFEVLEPAHLPLRKSGIAGAVLAIGFALLGAFLGMVVSVVRRLMHR